MAAGLAQRLAGDDEARRREIAFLGRLLQAEIGAADIAHRGEAAHQHLAHDHEGAGGHQRIRQLRVAAEIGDAGDDMDMGVDQARHQGLALEVDDLGLGRGDGLADLADGAALHEDADGGAGLRRGAVDDAGIGEEGAGHDVGLDRRKVGFSG
jgi:hypothetical protein